MKWVSNPKFCKYHRIVSHPVEKCFVLKELIMNVARQGRIELDVDEITDANVATIVFGFFNSVPLPALLSRLEFQSTRGILQELIMNVARQGRIELDVDEITDANVATIVFGFFNSVPLPALLSRLEFQSTRGILQVIDLRAKEVVGKPNN
ncbi:unnamed protein product [Prunus armeniaca]